MNIRINLTFLWLSVIIMLFLALVLMINGGPDDWIQEIVYFGLCILGWLFTYLSIMTGRRLPE